MQPTSQSEATENTRFLQSTIPWTLVNSRNIENFASEACGTMPANLLFSCERENGTLLAISVNDEGNYRAMWRISRVVKEKSTVLQLSGRLERDHLKELRRTLRAQAPDENLVLDLRAVTLVDQHAVTFLARCRAGGTVLQNCPGYIREWIAREKEIR
jgi:ABC-type transporter Mla MlaB component